MRRQSVPVGTVGANGLTHGRRLTVTMTVKRRTGILTTHAGSLPRPKALDALWARRWHGGDVDAAEIDALVEQATADVVARQIEVGIDIVGNGEQGRESFFTHVRDRFSGFGGTGDLRPFRDLREFPQFLEQRMDQFTGPG